jgi:hypothetical protein
MLALFLLALSLSQSEDSQAIEKIDSGFLLQSGTQEGKSGTSPVITTSKDKDLSCVITHFVASVKISLIDLE